MFVSAALNLIVALNFSVVTWSVTMSIWGIASKAAMFLIGYAVMRTIGAARRRRRDATEDRPIADDVVKAGMAS
jgi:intracellular septation protein